MPLFGNAARLWGKEKREFLGLPCPQAPTCARHLINVMLIRQRLPTGLGHDCPTDALFSSRRKGDRLENAQGSRESICGHENRGALPVSFFIRVSVQLDKTVCG
jgi:hypothetical protein